MIKPIRNYEGVHSIKENGEIISHGGKSNHKDDIILSQSIDKDGYKRVTLHHNNKKEYFRVCRLVAEHFCDGFSEEKQVHHIDKNKQNDHFTNLKCCTPYEHYKEDSGRKNPEMPVDKYSLYGECICTYKSLMEAARKNNINQGNITNCLKGRCKSVGGFRWKRK